MTCSHSAASRVGIAVRSAVGIATSRPSDLKSADWRPWHARSRRRRLLVQPIAALRDDFVGIAPHFCLASACVYLNYLTQGLLPWSSPLPPQALDRALENLREARNRQPEDADREEIRREALLAVQDWTQRR